MLTAERVPEDAVPLIRWASSLYWHPDPAGEQPPRKPRLKMPCRIRVVLGKCKAARTP
jgi:hypothetical protein